MGTVERLEGAPNLSFQDGDGGSLRVRLGSESDPLLPTISLCKLLGQALSGRREPVISSVTGRQLGDLPSMIQPPLLGVVNAASAVSARTLTCRAPAVPRSCSMVSVYTAVRRRPFPKLPPLEQNGCGPSTLISPA